MERDKTEHTKSAGFSNHRVKSKERLLQGIAMLMAALLFIFVWVSPSVASDCDACISCHGDF